MPKVSWFLLFSPTNKLVVEGLQLENNLGGIDYHLYSDHKQLWLPLEIDTKDSSFHAYHPATRTLSLP